MQRLLIVDGHNLLFQMFFGMPNKIYGAGGTPIHGVIGFVGALGKLISLTEPSHLLVMFDGERNNPRREILECYKAQRPDYSALPDDENPFTQLPYIYRALDYLGIKHKETADCETDDVIAAYARSFSAHGEVYISSFDSDYFQLINENTRVIRYRGTQSQICDRAYMHSKYGIEPEEYLAFKCLVGDTSDNIGGIRGIGPKSAAKIVSALPTVRDMLERPELIENTRHRTAIAEGKDILIRNELLIRLDGEADMPIAEDELTYSGYYPRTMDVIRGIGL